MFEPLPIVFGGPASNRLKILSFRLDWSQCAGRAAASLLFANPVASLEREKQGFLPR
jgi:hypothetical protein